MTLFKSGDSAQRVYDSFEGVSLGDIVTVESYAKGNLTIVGRPGLAFDATKFIKVDVVKPTCQDQVLKPGKHDPNGIDQHAPGAKLDAGKLRPALVLGGFASAVQAMVKVGSDGARKYTDNGWKTVPDGKARYEDALLRHLLAHLGGEDVDPESGSPHISHCMWNAAAIYELNKGNQNV